MRRRLLTAMLAMPMAGVFTSSTASAQGYPSKPVRVVVPFPPGGPVDLLGRMVSEDFGQAWGQPFVVDNKAGAAGNIGTDNVAKAAPDGYTIGVIPAGNIAVNPSLFDNLPYKASDLAPIAMLATIQNVLVVGNDSPLRSVDDVLKAAKARPGAITFGSPGAGSQAHLAGEMLALAGGVRMTHVPYKGMGPALNDLVGGQVSMVFGQMSAVLPFLKNGRLRAIGLANLQRSPMLPDVPTIAEQGIKDFQAVSWYALMAPAGTPEPLLDKLHAQVLAMLGKPAIKERYATLALEAGSGTRDSLARYIGSEAERWKEVIRKQGIKVSY